ncbi:winged helix-turn-helix domain-containing protein [Nocardia terpenica]|uniref:AfsR/SARP family transcriptional regulator n=1 Tax=Nocardia terpenica TaxID=455432 RepID=UPI0018932DBB|nr:BTAD domain-containing putative transcriptional regulator [Nocardia terpenica]MBF6059312.1 winged helix-turn-helix domain-containing protein [Nocardia terpenica]MBF6103149.1 winged helix-turn-helix domain-containing protein [Nocardia terpenica]MBF6110662.1 winged helix-turn-helix domain-containing protein [Nocardia terpenica]MBF6116793.1 winged helix-turn-helix domain-containing protein [Nocardia terpenica]
MEFLVLGPLVVRSRGCEVVVSAPRQRIVLAALLLSPNRVVSVERIAELVWDEALPPSAAATIRTYVMRLRQVLGAAGAERIQTRAPGYLLRVQDGDTDLGRFLAHRWAAKALAGTGDTEAAVEELDRGLSLWRHDPFLDVPCARLHESEGVHLRELRLQTVGWRMDLQLALNRHAEVLPELRRIVREQPLNEGFVGRLMLALSRVGQQPEALALYQRVRADLIGQFGMEPGTELREIHSRILRGDPAPIIMNTPVSRTDTPPSAADDAESPGVDLPELPMPAQLPPETTDFVGRRVETRELHDLLTEPRRRGAVIITGPAGIGKTGLLLRVAHAARTDFPDGQLYASLEGPDGAPTDPARIAHRFLIGLGVPRQAIPDDGPDRLALYRSIIAERRVLIALDDARDAAQIRPLLPGSGTSRILIASRARLTDLDGSHTVVLDPLTETTALNLLAGIIGRDRIDAEPMAARSIVRACSGVPLALRITGLRLLSRPNRSLGDTSHRLADPERLLDELQIGDITMRSTLDRAYNTLPQHSREGVDLRTAFRWLAMIADHCIRPHTVAILLQCTQTHAEQLLEDLTDNHLLHPLSPGHYTMSPHTTAYARERLYQQEPTGNYLTTLRRLHQHQHPDNTTTDPHPTAPALPMTSARNMRLDRSIA